jgi:hypothetical protein
MLTCAICNSKVGQKSPGVQIRVTPGRRLLLLLLLKGGRRVQPLLQGCVHPDNSFQGAASTTTSSSSSSRNA